MSIPPNSPRLPSPPPAPENQVGPKSPALPGADTEENVMEKSILEANAKRRIHPGTKAAQMATGPPLISLTEVRSS